MGRQVVTEQDILETSETAKPGGMAGDLAAAAAAPALSRTLQPDDFQSPLEVHSH